MVKRLVSVFLLSAAVLTASAQYQLLNNGFESWESVGNGEEPVNWSSFLTATGMSMVKAKQLEKSTDAHRGNYSAYIYARNAFAGIPAQGNLTTGCINGGSTNAKDASGNYNYTREDVEGQAMKFTGRPDAVRVWLKGDVKLNANVAVRLHAKGYYQDPLANESKCVALIGTATATPKVTDTWTQYEAPFTYVSPSAPYYALVTIATCNIPGDGSTSEYLYADDIEMVYYSDMRSCIYNGSDVQFDGNNAAVVHDMYVAKKLRYTSGAGAKYTVTEPTAENNYTMTIRIDGDNISEEPSNTHTYTIQFDGVEVNVNDESSATVTVPALEAKALANGKYYLWSMGGQGYLNDNNSLTNMPQQAWNLTGATSTGALKDMDGHFLVLDRTSYAASNDFSKAQFSIKSDATDIGDKVFTYKWGTTNNVNYIEFYRANLKYYEGGLWGIGAKSTNTYVGATGTTAFVAYNGSNNPATRWVIYEPMNWILNYLNPANASIDNGLTVSLVAFSDSEETTLQGLPLGVYSIDGGEKFYLPFEADLQIAKTNKSLTYYGRLNLALDATYDGAELTNGASVDEYYDENKLQVNLTGNGAQSYEAIFDEETYTLTITVKGYGRANEYTIQFAAPDLSLNATWYGEKVEDGATIAEQYDENKLVVTPGIGATSNTVYDAETGVATITLTCPTGSETYTINFLTVPETVATREYQATNDARYIIDELANGSISFTVANISTLGSVTASNVVLDKQGRFVYTGMLRGSADEQLTPVVIYGQYQGGTLVDAYADVVIADDLLHTTYGIVATQEVDTYHNNLVVTINGNGTTIPAQPVSVTRLENGNITFSLSNFQMDLDGTPMYVGDINIENIPMAQDGSFAFEGGILIGPGADAQKEWTGLGLGIVPVNMRGQVFDYNGQKQIITVIDITMESLKQTIHVTYGAEAGNDESYIDDLVVTINSASTTAEDTEVVVGYLKNGNINFELTNFELEIEGKATPVGNIAIDNIMVDERGNFTYTGVIRVGLGHKAGVTDEEWLGPTLGDVPVAIRGSLFETENGDGNCEDGSKHCAMVLDIQMESLGQTIHVTFGIDTDDTRDYTDNLAVTVNGQKTTQETTITVGTLGNGNINFTLDNFMLADKPIGSIAMENLVVDEFGKFSYEGTIRIGEGSDASVESWTGPSLEDVPVIVDGQFYGDKLLLNIDIDMEESLKQTINVTFGATPVSEKTYTDDLAVTVNGETATDEATITVGVLENGYINFTLNNFVLQGEEPMYIGNVAINALEVDEQGRFTYNGNVRIGAGDLQNVETWAGPALGAIPMVMKGQFYTSQDTEYCIVSIDIDMESSLHQTIEVLFGGTPVSLQTYTDNLAVTVNSNNINMPDTDVTVGTLRNGNINFSLDNFVLQLVENNSEMAIGNIAVNNLELDARGCFSYTGNVRIGKGTDANTEWVGPALGTVPMVLNGQVRDGKLYVEIDIEMVSMGQTIHVVFGEQFVSIRHLTQLIDQAIQGRATKADIDAMVNKILERAE